ncbi:MAG TPA: hypothetical protein VMH39_02460, partial [Gemmatimonadaceae bacterium]|nr:hypothetical protein [Gemmatimonadaceae bacterium]
NGGRRHFRRRSWERSTLFSALMVAGPNVALWLEHPTRGFPWRFALGMFAVAAPIMGTLTWAAMEQWLRDRAIRARRLDLALREPREAGVAAVDQ